MVLRRFPQLVIQQEELKHPVQTLEFFSCKPRQWLLPQGQVHPFAKLRPDRNPRIRGKDVRRETHIPKLTRNVAHRSQRLQTICLDLAWVTEDEVERDVNSAKFG